jgi:uncharacterized protein (DUF1330 family)
MTIKVIGLIELKDANAFEEYRSRVGQTVTQYKGNIEYRGVVTDLFWNELHCSPFSAYVELSFPSKEDAKAWAHSAEYQALLKVRQQAMTLTLFGVAL